MHDLKIGFIGGGNMATAMIAGLNGSTPAPAQIGVYDPNRKCLDQLQSTYNITAADSEAAVVEQSQVVVLAVKPQILRTVLRNTKQSIIAGRPLLISIAAGIRIDDMLDDLDEDCAIVRAMPNTPALIGRGASGVFAGAMVSKSDKHTAETILRSVGIVHWVNEESLLDAVTALSGSGPAYFMYILQSLIEAAEKAGLNHSDAKAMAVATAAGAAKLVASSDQSLEQLITNVTSPGGTTEAALQSFQKNDLRGTIQAGFEAAKQRSHALADEFGNQNG